jgi:hypothetical protein
MTTRLLSAIRRNGIYLTFVVVLGCDSFREDFIEPQNQVAFSQTEFYTLPGTSVVIDLKSTIKRAFTPVSLTISGNPTKGTITKIDPLILKYTPKPEFIEGTDEFVFAVVFDNGETANTQIMTIIMKSTTSELPCDVFAIEDFIHLKTPTTGAVHPLSNDVICGVDKPMDVFIHLSPKFGTAVIQGDSIIYTPGPSFRDGDELVYRLSGAGHNDVYGVVSIKRTRVEALENPHAYADIFFVNDSVGYLAGYRNLYKTTDGGEHWSDVYQVTDEAVINELFFLNEKTGYATFTLTWGDEANPEHSGGWLKTSDAGISWERVDLDAAVGSIFFTSPSTGYMATTQSDNWDKIVSHYILKTVNGGETWTIVAETSSPYGFSKVRFFNDNVGYAVMVDAIVYTENGGMYWTNSAAAIYISAIGYAPDNVITASFTDGNQSVTTPSYLKRTEDGITWKKVIDFPYLIMAHEYSPSGDMGIVAGISDPNPSFDPESHALTISLSDDKGLTWRNIPDKIKGFPWAMSCAFQKCGLYTLH